MSICLALINTVSFGEGFGFNRNILETNVINLSVVIAVVVSLGGDALRSLLENRKQTILNNLKEVEQRAFEAQERLNKAKLQLELAQTKAIEIRKKGSLASEQEKKQALKQVKEDISRLEQTQQETIRFQQQRAISKLSQQVVNLALQKVNKKLNMPLTFQVHKAVNDFNTKLLKKSSLSN